MNPMKILHVIPSVSRKRGGPSQALLELCKASQSQDGVSHSIATTTDDAGGVLDVSTQNWMQYDGCRIRFFPRWSPSARGLREFSYGIGMKTWLKANVRQFDLVHVHALFSYASSLAMRVAREAAVPYIVRPSGLLGTWPLRQSAWKKQMFLRLFDRRGLNTASAIEFTSELEADEARPLGLRSESFIMPYGMEFPEMIPDASEKLRGQLGIARDAAVLLFLSRLHHKKGLEVLLEALAGLNDQPWVLLIAGSGDAAYEASIRQRIAVLGLSQKVQMLGFVTGDFKNLLLRAADLFVLPSYSESFAIAVMEALACGCPVITTPGVPLASIVQRQDFGWVAEPNPHEQATAFRHALVRCRDQAWRGDLRQRGPDVMRRHFSWDVVARQMSAAYESVLSGRLPLSYPLHQVQ